MPETGNNTFGYVKKLSIRLRRGGLSFYLEAGREGVPVVMEAALGSDPHDASEIENAYRDFIAKAGTESFDRIQVYADTPDTVFVPARAVAKTEPAGLLSAVGVKPKRGAMGLFTGTVEGVRAAVMLDAGDMEWLDGKSDLTEELLSPLHEVVAVHQGNKFPGDCILVYPTQENVYITIYRNNVLEAAEVYPLRSGADILYYLTELTEAFGFMRNRAPVYVYGDRPSRYTRFIKKYFKKVEIVSCT